MKEEFQKIIESKDLKDISLVLLEQVMDNEISNDVLKEIPILKSILAIKNVYSSYSDRIFIKKAMTVLMEIGEINWKQRVELNRELDDEDEQGSEKILMAIDKLETTKKCKVFGRLCKLKALGKIDREDFLRLTKLIQDAYLDDLELVPYFVSKKEQKKRIYEEEFVPLISLGIIYQQPGEQKPIEKAYQYEEGDPEFKGGEIEFDYLFSFVGDTIKKYYYDLFPEQKK
jgi:hypothetical protein